MGDISATIVIPVFNGARFLRRCLDSVLAQTRGDFEVVCVDNGSTDDSLGILGEYAERDARITVASEPRPGVSCARNAGIARARGRYLLFVDADDSVEPTLVERVIEAADRHGAELVVYAYDECFEEPRAGFPVATLARDDLYDRPLAVRDLDFPVTLAVTPNVWRIAFAAGYVRSLGLAYPEALRTSEDLVFVHRALLPASRVVFLRDMLYHYCRDNAGSLTRGDREGAGILALREVRDALAPVSGQRWARLQLVNLVLDTFEYQMLTCATSGEYLRLFEGYQAEWSEYVSDNVGLVADRYARFLSRMDERDPLTNLFAQCLDTARKAEHSRVWDQAHKQELTACHEQVSALEADLAAARSERDAERDRAGALRAELDGVYASRSWRLARLMARVARGGRR